MHICGLCGLAALSASALAQTLASSALQSTATVTITGCVTGRASSLPIVLSEAIVLPYGSAAVAAESVAGDAFALPIPEGTPATPPLTPAVSTPGIPGAASSLGTIDIGSASIGIGTRGTSRTPSTPVGTAGLTAATSQVSSAAAEDSSASGVDGYRLSGLNVTPWIGRRVQITGVFVPSTAAEQPVAEDATVAGAEPPPPMPEFRVVSVQPVTGPCPK